MIPLGFMYKRIEPRPDWLAAPQVVDICSFAGCTSENVDIDTYAEGVTSLGLAPSADALDALCKRDELSSEGFTLFYYEGHPEEFDPVAGVWRACSFGVAREMQCIQVPQARVFEGYDIVEFPGPRSSGCSVLSCNSAADRVETNPRCLISSLEQARVAVASGAIQPAEPGPYRIVAVYTVGAGPSAGGGLAPET